LTLKNQTKGGLLMRNTMIRFLLVLVLTLSCAGCQSDNQTAGVALYQEALKLENEKSFDQASKLYEQALPILTDENNTQLAFACSEAMQRLSIFREMYPYTSDQIEDILLKTYPLATAEQINSWITSKDMEYLIWDDEEHFFADAARNLKFRDMDLMHTDMVAQQKYYEVVSKMIKTNQEETDHSGVSIKIRRLIGAYIRYSFRGTNSLRSARIAFGSRYLSTTYHRLMLSLNRWCRTNG